MHRTQKGFTLIELMIVVVIIGILAAIAIPNFIAMQNRAKEGSTKSNMHTLQLSAEDYGVQNDGAYAANCSSIAPMLPGGGANFKNPFDQQVGDGKAWKDLGTWGSANPGPSGLVSYCDTATTNYEIRGYGKAGPLTLILTSGQ